MLFNHLTVRLRQLISVRRIIASLLLSLWGTPSQAQVVSHITSDNTLGTSVIRNGAIYNITGGTRPGHGPNVFHSFDRFSIGTGDTARFSDPAAGIKNIVSRVTGGQQSVIDGQVQSTIPGANLFLLNPSGVLFRQNATLDVKGSLHVSSADYMRFANGTTFSAHLGGQSNLTVHPPVAFGFLSTTPAGLAVQSHDLHVPAGATLSLVGGDTTIKSGPNPFLTPTLTARGGQIAIASVAAAGEVRLQSSGSQPAWNVDAFERLGHVAMRQGAFLDVSGKRSGTVVIRSGRLHMDQSYVWAVTEGNTDGARVGVDLHVRDALTMTNNSTVETHTRQAGRAGDMIVHAGTIRLTGGAYFDSSTGSTGGIGQGGDIRIQATKRLLIARRGNFESGIYSETYSQKGVAGSVKIIAPILDMSQGGRIQTSTYGTRPAGNIVISAERVTVASGSQITSKMVDKAQGDAGAIWVTAAGTLKIMGQGSGIVSSDTMDSTGAAGTLLVKASSIRITDAGQLKTSTVGTGDAGSIVVQADRLALTGGGTIASDAFGSTGRAGQVRIQATEAITMAGKEDSNGSRVRSGIFSNTTGAEGRALIALHTPVLTMTAGATINAATLGIGRAGDIRIKVDRLTLTGGALVDSSALGATGIAGNITVRATEIVRIIGRDRLGVRSPSGLYSDTVGHSDAAGMLSIVTPRLYMVGGTIGAPSLAAGRPGDIVIKGDQVTLLAGAQIDNSTFGGLVGQRGNITVRATQAITIAGRDHLDGSSSGVFGNTTSRGDAGTISIATPILTMRGGAIAAQTTGPGGAGDIVLDVDRLHTTGTARITNRTFGPGAGGTITITAERLVMEGQSRMSSETAADQRAGNITVHADTVSLRGQAQISSSSGIFVENTLRVGKGTGGTVTVIAGEALTLTEKAKILSSAFGQGDAGRVKAMAPILTMLDETSIEATTRGHGDAGNVQIEAGRLRLMDRAQISSTSGVDTPSDGFLVGTGRGGRITVTATESITMTGPDNANGMSSGIFSRTGGAGRAGTITISAPLLTMQDAARIGADTGGDGRAGDVRVQVERASLTSGAQISSASGIAVGEQFFVGTGAGGTVTLRATDTARIIGQDSGLSTNTAGQGRGGDIILRARQVHLAEGARLTAGGTSTGNAGHVTIKARETMQIAQSAITTTAHEGRGGSITLLATDAIDLRVADIAATVTSGQRPGGSITLKTPRLIMTGGRIAAETQGAGNAGNIGVRAGTVIVQGGAELTSSSTMPAAGAAGTVTIQGREARAAAKSIRVTDSALSTRADGDGAGGNILLRAQHVTLDEATMTATANTGAGGRITVEAPSRVELNGTEIAATVTGGNNPGGDITLTTPTLAIRGGSLAAETQGAGQAGNITLNVGTLLAQGTNLTSSSTVTATGNAGTVTIQGTAGRETTATQVTLTHSTLRTAAAGTGGGGAVTITANEALVLDHTTLVATVNNGTDIPDGPRGDITVQTPRLTLRATQLEAETTGTRRAGDIALHVGQLMAQQATVTSSSTGIATGNAGTITIQGFAGLATRAQTVTLTQSTVATEATIADGGNIQVLAQDVVRLRDSRLTTAVRSGDGQGGNILIAPEFVIMERSQILADAFGGPGGNIRIVAQAFLADAASRVSASSAQNVNGTIAIEAFTNPSGLVAPVATDFAAVTTLLQDRCAARLREGLVSSFVVVGRDGVPPEPEGGLPSLLLEGVSEPEAKLGEQQGKAFFPALSGVSLSVRSPVPFARAARWHGVWGAVPLECVK